jgi:hypothetical protein
MYLVGGVYDEIPSNDVRIFDLTEGNWMIPFVTGNPPKVNFALQVFPLSA